MAPFSMSQSVPWTAFYPGDTKLDQTVSTQQGVSLQERVKCGSGPNPVKDTRLWWGDGLWLSVFRFGRSQLKR
jgi:hypothetical protein